MYRQFSPFDLRISAPINADSSLHWREYLPSVASLPLYAKITDKYYLLCGGDAETALVFDAESKFGALALSIEAIGAQNVVFAEWVNICKICISLNCAVEELPLPEPLRKRYLPLIKQAVGWDEALLKHIAAKNPPWHTLHLIYLLKDEHKQLLTDFVRKESPSAQSFKLFIEKLRDFAPEINSTVYDKAEFERITDRRTALHTELDGIIAGLQFAQNPDNYESATLNWAFSTRDTGEFMDILHKLKDKEALVERFYKLQNGEGR